MSKHKLIIKSHRASLLLITSNTKILSQIKKSEFLKRYIPSYALIDGKPSVTDCQLTVEIGKTELKINYPKAHYCVPKLSECDVVSLIELMLERARQERGIVCLHGSAAVIDGQGIIFWGGSSGMGKTSLAGKVARDFNGKFYADEKILIDLERGVMVGGVGTAYLKKDKKNSFTPINYNYDRPIPITILAYAYLADTASKLQVEKWSGDKLEWHLYEELCRKIRATSRRLNNGSLPVMSIDTPRLAQKRIVAVRKLAQKVPSYYLLGNSDDLIKKIIKIVK